MLSPSSLEPTQTKEPMANELAYDDSRLALIAANRNHMAEIVSE